MSDPADRSSFDEPDGEHGLAGTDFDARFDAVLARLNDLARRQPTRALTDPEPGGEERWDGAQVWAHMAEFVPYWHEQVESIIGEYDGSPVPFGRLQDDPGRLEGIEIGRRESVGLLHDRVERDIQSVRRYLTALTPAEWQAVGLHPVRGDMDIETIVDRFLATHLEDHADQLDKLG